MEKQAFLPLVPLAAKAIGFTASKILPKALNAGYKGLVRPMARMAFKRPGLALTGAMMPSWIGGYSNTAGQKGLSSLPRKLPKFASACTQGEEMLGDKYPDVFYKVAGFEKMAAEAEMAHRLVKRAFLGKLLGGSSSSDAQMKILDRVLRSVNIGKDELADAYADRLMKLVKEMSKKPSLGKELMQSARNMPATLKVGLPAVIAYPFASKAYKDYGENKEMDASYRNMLRVFPELQRESPQTTRQNFDFIKQYSPTVAKNPYAAGTLVKGVVAGRGIDQSTIKTLLEVEKVKADTKPRNSGILATVGALI